MTPPNQQSEVDEAITILREQLSNNPFTAQSTKSCLQSLITEIHRLRLERVVALNGLKRLEWGRSGFKEWATAEQLRQYASETLQKLGEKV